jgi:hypothetical protein
MSDLNQNPLAQYFRSPGVHVSLPTGGQFFDEGEVKFAMNGEIAVYPMTATDEIMLKNPDALLNGHALERLFQSCVPDIKNPRNIPTPDMDVLLLAIKLASYGDDLGVDVTCPKCEQETHFEMSIRALLETATPVDATTELRINENILLYLRPYDFQSKTTIDLAAFEETKLYQFIVDAEISDEERSKQFAKSFEKIAALNLDLLARCITKIVVPNAEVTEANFILEYVRNSDKNVINQIQEAVKALGEGGIERKVTAMCSNEECKHEWETDLVFDPTHFFG